MARTRDPELEERRRQQVMLTVYRLLASDSFAAMTLARVAREAGVSKGLVTYYFKNKDQLIVETIRSYHEEQERQLLQVVEHPKPPRELLRGLVSLAFPSQALVELELRFQIEVWSFAKTRPEAWQAIAASYQRFRGVCEKLLQRGVDEGWLRPERIPWLYRFIQALADGLSFQVALEPELDVDALRAELCDLIDRLLAD